jgi:nitroreductase
MKRYSAQADGAWVSEFISSRRTTRDFLSTPVPSELIDQILKDSLTAPSWSNTRPFKVAVATGEVRDRISNEFLSRWSSLSAALGGGIVSKLKLFIKRHGLPTSNRIILKPYVAELKPRAQRVGKELYGMLGVKRGDKSERYKQWGKNYEFFGAPVALFVYIHKSLHIYAAADAGLMMENLMLSAHAHGLGTCAQGAVAFWDDVIREEFEVSKNYRLLCGIAVGYPSDAAVNNFQAHRIGIEELQVKLRQKKN